MLFARLDVDGWQAAAERRDRLHESADDDILSVRHSSFETARPIRGAVVAPLLVEVDRIVNLRADAARARDTIPNRHRLHRMNGKNRLPDSSIELVGPLHIGAESQGHSVRRGDDGAAEGLAGFASGVDRFDHRLLMLAFHCAERRIIIDGAELFPRRRIFGIACGADRDDSRSDLDFEDAQQFLRDGTGGNA